MKRIIAITALSILLSSCSDYKTKNVLSFTKPIEAESDYSENIILSKKTADFNPNKALNNMHIAQEDVAVKPKFARKKFSNKISAMPSVIDNRIHVLTSNGALWSIDENSKKEIWKTYISNKRVKTTYEGGGVKYSAGKLYVTNGSSNLAILNYENGRRVTVKKFEDILNAAPLLSKDKVYILSLSNQLYALGKSDLGLHWDHFGSSDKVTFGKKNSFLNFDSKHNIFVSFPSGQTFMLNPEDGSKIWELSFDSNEQSSRFIPSNIAVEPVFDGKNLFIADSRGKLHRYDLNNNSKVWEANIDDIQSLNKSGNAIFVTNSRRQVAAVSAKNGKVLWVTDLVDDVDAYILSKQEAEEIAEKNLLNKQEEDLLEAKSDKKIDSEDHKNWLARIKNKFNYISKPKAHKAKEIKPKHHYDYNLNKQKPLDIIRTFVMNDALVIFTSKGKVYYINPYDGTYIGQKDLKKKISYVIPGDKMLFVYNDTIFYEK